ncbi:S41 family peptidase [Elizabethkingia meningoseptica]|uniref:S41 family peptidase n=1 Tax=Elizabethkingia meningoseptica TaxID=238 RepID=UPI002013507F|nr:S41 family peptidase [Elizabethkingia meningoseptica]MCL1675466.1 S41 family peptidase [Elizabethkingia meningoseptica]MCL1687118.1 S41 family peptidase [Elizabethkingia meningoseptica]
MTKKVFILPMLLIGIAGFAQYSVSEISKDAYLKDFDIAVDIIKKQHPNPYRFHSKEVLDKKLDSLRKEIVKNPAYINFYLNTPTKVLGDGHSSMGTDPNYMEDFLIKTSFFPLATYVQNGNTYVNSNNKYGIEAGSRILEVNNKKISDIFNQVPKTADGSIKVEDVDMSSYISYAFSSIKEFWIKYENPKGEQKTVKLSSINYPEYIYETRHAILPTDVTASDGIFGYQLNPATYYLIVKSFSSDESFLYERLKKYFREMKDMKVKNLILDIRDNGGGAISNVPLLYSFLSKEKLFNNSYQYGTKVVDIKYKDYLIDSQTDRYYSENDIRDLDNFMQQRFDKSEKGDYYFGNTRLDNTYVKSYPRDGLFFDGKVVLITNNRTFSAATYFASLFKAEKRGVIVGKETGSCSNFTTAAWFITYKLPNTKSTLSIPRTEVFFNGSGNDNITKCTGVIPDYTLKTDYFMNAMKEQKDPELEFSKTLLSK